MPAREITSVLIAGQDAESRAAAVAAARSAFPTAKRTELASLAEAIQRDPHPQREILILLSPSRGEWEQAGEARDARGAPRWALAYFGQDPLRGDGAEGTPETVPPRIGARLLVEAVARHRLARENARLQGDLRTLCRRISHDLRTPLANISASASALDLLAPGPESPQAELTRSVERSVGEIVQLIDRVNFLLRATSDPLPRESLAMKDIVEAALQRIETRTRERSATITRPDQWPEVKGVPEWVEVIWCNLVANSLEHVPTVPRIVLGWMPMGGHYRFWVRDNGPGVPPDRRGQMFAPFDLLHRLNSPPGLGLPIVHRLVELQGGQCGYEALAGGGSRLSFTLPFN